MVITTSAEFRDIFEFNDIVGMVALCFVGGSLPARRSSRSMVRVYMVVWVVDS